VIPDSDVAENLRPRPDYDVVAQRGVPFPFFLARATERHALVKQAIVPNDGSFADDDAHPVIDEKSAADLSARVNLNAGHQPGDLADDARRQRHTRIVKAMGEAVQQDRVKAGVAEKDLKYAPGGRVLPEYRFDLFPNGAEHGYSIM
jgi:hypothetical protein